MNAASTISFAIVSCIIWQSICIASSYPNPNTLSHKECPNKFVRMNTSCYHFSKEDGTWLDGVKFCAMYNSQLVSIESAEESSAIKQHIFNIHANTSETDYYYWTSGSDIHNESEYIWMATGKPLFGYKTWCSSQPDNNNGNEHCINIILWKNQVVCWQDNKCSLRLNFICKS